MSSQLASGHLISLLSEWNTRRGDGRPCAAADLCPEDLSLQRQLAAHIAAIENVEGRRDEFAESVSAGSPVGLSSPPGLQLQEELGRGGMGVVFRALDTHLMRDVAVKVLSEWLVGNRAAVRRFLDEARVTGQLTHTAIPPVHQLGTLGDGRPYLAMKLIRGRTLAEELRDRPDPLTDLADHLRVVEQVCQAVGYAHSRRVIHRDLKPGNVMVGRFGEVQVMDWGLAKEVPSTAQACRNGTTIRQELAGVESALRPPKGPSGTFTASVISHWRTRQLVKFVRKTC